MCIQAHIYMFGASQVAQLVKNPPVMQGTQFNPWRRGRLPTPGFLGFPGGSAGKESTCNAGELSSIPGLGRSPGGGHGNPCPSHGQRSLVGYSPWGRKESDTPERLSTSTAHTYFTDDLTRIYAPRGRRWHCVHYCISRA